MGNLQKGNAPESLRSALSALDKVIEDEAEVLRHGGLSCSGIGELLGELGITLGALQEFPSGATLELARRRVREVRGVMCELSERGEGFWDSSSRPVKTH